ncbi:hypothetical protein K1T71_001492 [Dendrolimus kikuchii]|uniref:Uncharacterized protein n=1 Tax=Dendrolimus kikuchii TaxID=765133 RepID=A0ACC1DI39_9NEOP|nr:hypothetical protein K1T71_001492 [Dendrolimus kikuchii]
MRLKQTAVLTLFIITKLSQISKTTQLGLDLDIKISDALNINKKGGNQNSKGVKLELDEGVLEGEILEISTGGQTYNSFKGIPYAAPPVGNLRFKAPEPPLKWKGVRSAKKHGSQCVQRSFFGDNVKFGSEDCLFLNVYTPNLIPNKSMAVIIYIHGGGYTEGSGDSDILGPDFLMQYDIVLVTINYRLGPLGFLGLDTIEVPGNAGLKDQIAAMRWVKKYIAKFGGDPDNVTLMGQNAGGAAVSLHTVSQMSNGLFKRAIIISGSFLNDYAIAREPRKRAFILGRKLGLDTNNVTELYVYLQKADLEKMFKANPDILMGDEDLAKLHVICYYGPVVEKKVGGEQFLTESPEVLERSGKVNQVDIIIGHTNLEALYIDAILEKDILELYPIYQSLLVSVKVRRIVDPFKALELSDQVRDYYFGNKTISSKTMNAIINFDTDNHYVYDIYRLLIAFPENIGTKKYSYTFSYHSSRNIFSRPGRKYNLTGAAHTDDLQYIFDRKTDGLSPVNKSSDAYRVIKRQCQLFTNFAKYSNPTPDTSLGVTWQPYTADSRNEMIMGENLEPTVISFEGSFLGFWKKFLTSVDILF